MTHELFQDRMQAEIVVVGGGPSLDFNVESLARHCGQVFTIASDGSLRTLLRNGVVPDVVVSLEDSPLSWRFATGHLDLLANVPIILPYRSNHVLVRGYPGPVVFVRVEEAVDWIDPFIRSLPFVRRGLCVGHFGFHLAQALQPERIVLMGFDLAFRGERFHPRDMPVQYYHDRPPPNPVTGAIIASRLPLDQAASIR